MLPLAFDLTGKPVLVVGAGVIGVRKAMTLLAAGARVTLLSEHFPTPVPDELRQRVHRRYQRGDLEGYFLVISATGDAATNDAIVREANERALWLNVVDDLDRSSFYFTAVTRRGDVVVSVSTSGASPALAQELRDVLATHLPDNLGDIAERLREQRQAVHAAGGSTEDIEWRSRVRELLHPPEQPES